MDKETEKILRQHDELFLLQREVCLLLAQSNLLIIESVQQGAAPATLGSAAAILRQALEAIDAFVDRILSSQ